MITASSVDTSTCDSVSMASAHTPSTPIRTSITSVVRAGRRPEMTSAIRVSPATVANQGDPTRKLWIGRRMSVRMELPVGSVIPNTHDWVLHEVEHDLNPAEDPLLQRRRLLVCPEGVRVDPP